MPKNNKYDNCSFLCSWSGGKDSYLAYHRAVQSGLTPSVLFNVLNERGDKSRSHGIPREVLEAQAASIGIPIEFIESTWEDYEKKYVAKLIALKSRYGFSHAVFGDIDIQAHRDWEEKVSKAAGLTALLPLWLGDRIELVNQMIDSNIKALIVSCQGQYVERILGRYVDTEMLQVFKSLGIDECGENGEYHTLVIDGPEHHRPLKFTVGASNTHKHYTFLDLSMNLNS